MAYFAELDNNNIVTGVISVNNDILILDGKESETAGIDFLETLYGHRNFKQTSYNKSIRKNYAEIGGKYDVHWDAFIPTKPYDSWLLDYETFTWKAPIPKPEDTNEYFWRWGEINKEWIKVQLPVEE